MNNWIKPHHYHIKSTVSRNHPYTVFDMQNKQPFGYYILAEYNRHFDFPKMIHSMVCVCVPISTVPMYIIDMYTSHGTFTAYAAS